MTLLFNVIYKYVFSNYKILPYPTLGAGVGGGVRVNRSFLLWGSVEMPSESSSLLTVYRRYSSVMPSSTYFSLGLSLLSF